MDQTSMQLTPTHTRYTFAGSGVAIDLAFFTPAFLDDMDLLSRPAGSFLTKPDSIDNGAFSRDPGSGSAQPLWRRPAYRLGLLSYRYSQ